METKSCKSYRNMAWNTLSSRWGEVAVMMLIIVLCACIGSGISIYGNLSQLMFWSMFGVGASFVLTILLVGPFTYAFQQVLLSYVRQTPNDEGGVQTMFHKLGRHYADFVVTSMLMYIVVIGIGLVTLGIGAIIFSFAYAMVPFVMHDNPELSAKEILNKSRMIMRGHKMELFGLILSFIGWWIVGIITLYVGFLWIGPYMNTAIAHFYEDIKE